MVKRTLTLSLISLSTICSLNGCNQNEQIILPHLDYGTIFASPVETISQLNHINYDDLRQKINYEESFVLAIYNGGCTCWDDFKPVLIESTNNYNIKFDIIHVDYLINEEDYGLIVNKNMMPSIAIFKKGKLYIQKTYLDDELLFKDSKHLSAFINENVVKPKQYFIDKETLDSKINNNEEFVICFTTPNDYSFRQINKNVINDWNYETESVNSPIYIFNLKNYINDQSVLDLYGLSYSSNETFGYLNGVIPTFQKRKGNNILDAAIMCNDSQSEGVISSFYTNEKAKNLPFLKDAKLNYNLDGIKLEKANKEEDWDFNWSLMKYDYYQKYHYPILKLFISTYIK